MKKSTVIIIIVLASVIILSVFTTGIVLLFRQLGPTIEKEIKNIEQVDRTDPEKAATDMAAAHNGSYWAGELKTSYSFEIRDKIKQINNSTIVFTANLIDITKENGSYFVIFQDQDLSNAPFSIFYKLSCTEEQVGKLTGGTPSDGYYIYIGAARIDRIYDLPQKEEDIWGPPVMLYGTFLDYEAVEQPYDY